MPVGVSMKGDPNSDNNNAPEPSELVLLNDTLYNNPIGVILNSQLPFSPGVPQVSAAVQFVAMDTIFDGSTTAVVEDSGMIYSSMFQYDLFFNDGPHQIQLTGGLGLTAFPAISTAASRKSAA